MLQMLPEPVSISWNVGIVEGRVASCASCALQARFGALSLCHRCSVHIHIMQDGRGGSH